MGITRFDEIPQYKPQVLPWDIISQAAQVQQNRHDKQIEEAVKPLGDLMSKITPISGSKDQTEKVPQIQQSLNELYSTVGNMAEADPMKISMLTNQWVAENKPKIDQINYHSELFKAGQVTKINSISKGEASYPDYLQGDITQFDSEHPDLNLLIPQPLYNSTKSTYPVLKEWAPTSIDYNPVTGQYNTGKTIDALTNIGINTASNMVNDPIIQNNIQAVLKSKPTWKPDDVITSFGGTPIFNGASFEELSPMNQAAAITIRDGAPMITHSMKITQAKTQAKTTKSEDIQLEPYAQEILTGASRKSTEQVAALYNGNTETNKDGSVTIAVDPKDVINKFGKKEDLNPEYVGRTIILDKWEKLYASSGLEAAASNDPKIKELQKQIATNTLEMSKYWAGYKVTGRYGEDSRELIAAGDQYFKGVSSILRAGFAYLGNGPAAQMEFVINDVKSPYRVDAAGYVSHMKALEEANNKLFDQIKTIIPSNKAMVEPQKKLMASPEYAQLVSEASMMGINIDPSSVQSFIGLKIEKEREALKTQQATSSIESSYLGNRIVSGGKFDFVPDGSKNNTVLVDNKNWTTGYIQFKDAATFGNYMLLQHPGMMEKKGLLDWTGYNPDGQDLVADMQKDGILEVSPNGEILLRTAIGADIHDTSRQNSYNKAMTQGVASGKAYFEHNTEWQSNAQQTYSAATFARESEAMNNPRVFEVHKKAVADVISDMPNDAKEISTKLFSTLKDGNNKQAFTVFFNLVTSIGSGGYKPEEVKSLNDLYLSLGQQPSQEEEKQNPQQEKQNPQQNNGHPLRGAK